MKRFIGTFLAIIILVIPSVAHADNFIEKIRLTNGESEVYKKFKIKEGEYISIDAINKSDGAVTVFIEDEEGNRVSTVVTLDEGFERSTEKKNIKVDLPKGKYYLRAEGRYTSGWIKNYNEEANGFVSIRFKTIRYKK